MVYDQQLCEQVQQLQEDKRLTQQHQLKTNETLQQVMRQSEHLQQQLTHEQETANRRTREVEEKNCGLQQQVSLIHSTHSYAVTPPYSPHNHQVRHVQEEKAHIEEEFHQQVSTFHVACSKSEYYYY